MKTRTGALPLDILESMHIGTSATDKDWILGQEQVNNVSFRPPKRRLSGLPQEHTYDGVKVAERGALIDTTIIPVQRLEQTRSLVILPSHLPFDCQRKLQLLRIHLALHNRMKQREHHRDYKSIGLPSGSRRPTKRKWNTWACHPEGLSSDPRVGLPGAEINSNLCISSPFAPIAASSVKRRAAALPNHNTPTQPSTTCPSRYTIPAATSIL